MPIDRPDLGQVTREKAIPLPPGDLVLTPETLEKLQLPESVVLNPRNIAQFLASQSIRYNEVVNRPEIKTLEAEIPEFFHTESAAPASELSQDEQQALGEFRQGVAALMTTQSGDQTGSQENMDNLEGQIRNYLDEAMKNNPEFAKHVEAQQTGEGFRAVDMFDQMFISQSIQQTEEQKKKYLALLAAAKGDPDAILLAMTYRQTSQLQNQLGKLVESYKYQMDGFDKLQAELDLKSSKGDLSQADMLKANVEFGRVQGDASQIFHLIQKAMSDYERVMVSAQSIEKSTHEQRHGIIRNIRTG